MPTPPPTPTYAELLDYVRGIARNPFDPRIRAMPSFWFDTWAQARDLARRAGTAGILRPPAPCDAPACAKKHTPARHHASVPFMGRD